jgi:rhomboid protease GluP
MRPGTKFPLLSATLVLISCIAWVAIATHLRLQPFQSQKSSLLLEVGAVNGATFRSGEVWRLLTSQFLHVHFLHMLFTLIGIFLLASAIERTAGSVTLAVTYFAGGTIGQYFSVLLSPQLVSSGASQALMALCGFALLAHRRFSLPRLSVLSAAAIVVVQISLDVYASGAIKPGHSSGFVAGMALAALLNRPRSMVGRGA